MFRFRMWKIFKVTAQWKTIADKNLSVRDTIDHLKMNGFRYAKISSALYVCYDHKGTRISQINLSNLFWSTYTLYSIRKKLLVSSWLTFRHMLLDALKSLL